MTKRQLHCTNEIEVIDDSEPERQEVRRRLGKERIECKTKTRKRASQQTIEISDDDSVQIVRDTLHISASDNNMDNKQPAVKDSSVRACRATSRDNDIIKSNSDVKDGGAENIATSGDLISQENELDNTDDELEECTENLRSELNSYIFSGSIALPRSGSMASQTSLISLNSETRASDIKAIQSKPFCSRSKATADMISEFPGNQLALLRKCISCDISWTVRKSVAQKLVHIQSCSKKNRISNETVKELIANELKSQPPLLQSACNGKKALKTVRKAGIKENPTLLERLVREVPAQRQIRVQDSMVTIKDISETRDDFLDKAKKFLDKQAGSASAINQEMHAHHPHTQIISQCGPSLQSAHHNTIYSIHREPPTTQAFGRSTLGLNFAGNRTVLDYDSAPISPSNGSHVAQARELSTTSLDESLLRSGLSLDVVSFAKGQAPDEEYEFDDAILVYNGEGQGALTKTKHPKSNILQILDNEINKQSPCTIVDTPTTRRQTGLKKKRAKPTRTGDIGSPTSWNAKRESMSDETLSVRLKEIILSDDELYARILRYEPIHFDIFLSRAKQRGINALALKTKIRAFLDKQAIHFYGSEPGGSRARH